MASIGVTIVAQAIKDLEVYFEEMPNNANVAMRMAINDVAQRVGVKRAREEIAKTINFRNDYLSDPSRLGISKKATNNDLEAVVTARARATSLARFGVGDMTPGKRRVGGLQVQVKKGNTVTLKKAFPIRLKRGASLSEDNFNVGLAIRLKPGEAIINKRQVNASEIQNTKAKDGSSLYLLYGPSVDQIFRTVADEISPEITDKTTDEFLRQFLRLLDGR